MDATLGEHCKDGICAQLEALSYSCIGVNINTSKRNLRLECCCEFLDRWLKTGGRAAPGKKEQIEYI
jgi:hypothetical protein